MANLIRLKQIESGSALQTSAEVGADFSQSVIAVVSGEVAAVLPDGVVSSSTQIQLVSASGYEQLATDIELSVVSGAISATIEAIETAFVTTASFNTYTESINISTDIFSSSIDFRVTNLENFSTSIDLTYATDAELAISQSNINVDMGEW